MSTWPCVWISSTHIKVKNGADAYNPRAGQPAGRIPRARWLARLAKSVSSRFSEGPCFKKQNGEQLRKTVSLHTRLCACAHAATHQQAPTHAPSPTPKVLYLRLCQHATKNARRHGFSAMEGCSFTGSNRASSDLVASEKFSIHGGPAMAPRASLWSPEN